MVRGSCLSDQTVAIAPCGFSLLLVSGCGGGGDDTNQAFTAHTLYSFGEKSNDALGPNGALVQGKDGNFYGISSTGGTGGGPMSKGGFTGAGAVFKITPSGTEIILHAFADTAADGANPRGLTQGSDGNLYGTTLNGGANSRGTVFELTPGGVMTILYSFPGGNDGDHPAAGVIQANDGNFYGTAINYFENSNGMVFELTPEGILTRLHSFASSPTDGVFPQGSLLLGSDGNLYGTTSDGGPNNLGTVFKVTPNGVETILHSFGGTPADGAAPNLGVVQGADSNLYGTTSKGGTNGYGTVFKLTPDGVETVLYSFSGTGDGAYPTTALVQGSNGNFYGGTYSGGVSAGSATIFELTSAGVVTSLYSFPSAANSVTNLVNGSDGNLYGTTYQGGTHESGTFFRFRLN
jgi:uncharacterized repeat protein (TIGR03803 family)